MRAQPPASGTAALFGADVKPWTPKSRERARLFKETRGKALHQAWEWARRDPEFMSDLTRLVRGSKPRQQSVPLVLAVSSTVWLFLASGDYKLTTDGKQNVFRAVSRWYGDPYRIDALKLSTMQVKRLYYDGIKLGLIEPPEK